MSFNPRQWQKECLERFKEHIERGGTTFILEACMGAGKSNMAAMMTKLLIDEYGVDHALVLVPWTSIQGDTREGMLGAFGEIGLLARDQFFTYSRRQVRQSRPHMDATVTLYQEACCQQTLEAIRMWQAELKGFRFVLACDEIHHTNEIKSTWGTYVEQLEKLAAYSIFMSGTFFRTDKIPISCIPLKDGIPVKHYRYTYSEGVRDNVVRAIATREIDAKITFYDREKDKDFQVPLKQITQKQLAEAKKQVLDPYGACMRQLIETVDADRKRLHAGKFSDAGWLFVCRPGGSDDYTLDESQEDKHVHQIAEQIKALTGITPIVVTYRDRDAVGKVAWFRKSNEPYLVAVNMVSEGCNIPRLRGVAFCRYTESEMLFRQIAGRCLRIHTIEDGTAATLYIPAFPLLVEFAARLYAEAQEGIRNRPRCPECDQWPCVCPCPHCGQRPCICPCPMCGQRPCVCPPSLRSLIAIDAEPLMDGGHVGHEHVIEHYVSLAATITKATPAHQHFNPVQVGHMLQQYEKMKQDPQGEVSKTLLETDFNPGVERELLIDKINRFIRRLAINVYGRAYATAHVQEIEVPFGAKWTVIQNTWPLERLRQIALRLEQRIMEALRRG
jgi:superfamily II DNA or RNA helicase